MSPAFSMFIHYVDILSCYFFEITLAEKHRRQNPVGHEEAGGMTDVSFVVQKLSENVSAIK